MVAEDTQAAVVKATDAVYLWERIEDDQFKVWYRQSLRLHLRPEEFELLANYCRYIRSLQALLNVPPSEPSPLSGIDDYQRYDSQTQLQNSYSKFVLPDCVLEEEHNLALLYDRSRLRGDPLRSVLAKQNQDVPGSSKQRLWRDAAELLHTLHQKGVVHGHIAPQFFNVRKKQVSLWGFGYEPLLRLKKRPAIAACGKYLLQSDLNQGVLQPTVDLYAFAQTITELEPELIETEWYQRATAVDPRQRFPDVLALYNELEKIWEEQEHLSTPGEPGPKPQKTEIQFTITALAEPPDAGEVARSGDGPDCRLQAKPAPGWQFDSWGGDLSGSNNPQLLTLNADKKVTAIFSPIPVPVPVPEPVQKDAPVVSDAVTAVTPPVVDGPPVRKLSWTVLFSGLLVMLGGTGLILGLSPQIEPLCRTVTRNCNSYETEYNKALAQVESALNQYQRQLTQQELKLDSSPSSLIGNAALKAIDQQRESVQQAFTDLEARATLLPNRADIRQNIDRYRTQFEQLKLNYLRLRVKVGSNYVSTAKNTSQRAQNIAALETASQQLKEAIGILHAIPDDQQIPETKKIITDSQKQLKDLAERIKVEQQAEKQWSNAAKMANDALNKARGASTLGELQAAQSQLEKAIAQLNKVPGNSFVASKTKDKQAECEQASNTVASRIADLQAPQLPPDPPRFDPSLPPPVQPAPVQPAPVQPSEPWLW